MSDLKPCPFCGSKAAWPEPEVNMNYVQCTECGASTNTIEQWNARPLSAQTAPAEVVGEPFAWMSHRMVLELKRAARGYATSVGMSNVEQEPFTVPVYSTPTQAEAKEAVGEPTMLPDHARFELAHGEMLLSDDGPWVRYVEFITALKVQEDSYLGWLKIARETIEKLETPTPTQAEAKEAAIRECIAIVEAEEKLRTDAMDAAANGSWEWGEPETAKMAQGHKAITAHAIAEQLRALLTKGEAR